MHRKWLSVLLISLIIFNILNYLNAKTTKKIKSTKSIKFNHNKKNQIIYPSLSDNLMSNIKLEEVMVPIKKLTRKKLIKLLIKSIKRVNKTAKKLNKSDDKSKELRPTKTPAAHYAEAQPHQRSVRKQDHEHQTDFTKTNLNSNHLNYAEAPNDLRKINEINFMLKNNDDLLMMSRTNSPFIKTKSMQRKEDEYRNPFQLVSQSYNLDSNNQVFLKSIDNQQANSNVANVLKANIQTPHTFNNHLLNTEYSLINDLNHLQPYHFFNSHYYSNYPKEAFNLDKHSNSFFARNEEDPDQIIRIRIPMNELTHYPIFVKDQMNSTSTQNFIKSFVKSQLDQITSRSDTSKLTSKLFTFLAKQLDIDTDQTDKRAQELALQTGITKVLGAFVGDLFASVIEEILHKKGDKIADGVRTRIGDIATLLINKSNMALEFTFRNLSRLIVKRRLNY